MTIAPAPPTSVASAVRAWVDEAVRRPGGLDAAWDGYVTSGWVGFHHLDRSDARVADRAVLIEELARGSASFALRAHISYTAMVPLRLVADGGPLIEVVESVAAGQLEASFCLSEPQAGSDIGAVATTATRDGGHYVLDGTKAWVLGAGVSAVHVVFAQVDGAGLTCFVVTDPEGIRVVRHERAHGMRGVALGRIELDGVRVPVTQRVGPEGGGSRLALATLARTRPLIAAQAVGLAQAALDLATDHVSRRHQFGRPVGDNQGVRFTVADLATAVAAARALTRAVAAEVDQDPDTVGPRAAMAKLFATDTAVAVAGRALELMGGIGCTEDVPVGQMLLDAKAMQIYEGTNLIQRVVIADHVLPRPGTGTR